MSGASAQWWATLGGCPVCGHAVATPNGHGGVCSQCGKTWRDQGSIRVWRDDVAQAHERHVPHEWTVGRQSTGAAHAAFLARRAVWNVLKVAGLPVRALLQRKLSSFQSRSTTDATLAQGWRDYYLRGLSLPSQPVWFEHSYRTIEKLGFARALGHHIVVQDIRTQDYWAAFDRAWCQVVPPAAPHFPLRNGVADVAFTDGAIFDVEAGRLTEFFAECLRILKPGGYAIVWAGNSLARSRAMSEVRWHGRIHSLRDVRAASVRAGLSEVDHWFEGFAPPFLPTAISTLRHALAPWPFKTFDNDSWLARLQKPQQRAHWLLRLIKPATSVGVAP